MKKYWKIIFSIILTFIATAFLFVFMKSPLFNIQVFDKEILNFYANYEFSTLIVSSTLLLALYLLAD